MIKITKGKAPKAVNENEVGPLAMAGAGKTPHNLRAVAKAFAPVVEYRAVKDLKANYRNARVHSPRQVQQIAASMSEFGWLAPIVIDEEDTVLAGHGRLRAATLLKMETVPTIPVKHLTPERKRAFMLADKVDYWPEDLRWLRDYFWSKNLVGTPRFALVRDNQLIRHDFGIYNWTAKMWPAIQNEVA